MQVHVVVVKVLVLQQTICKYFDGWLCDVLLYRMTCCYVFRYHLKVAMSLGDVRGWCEVVCGYANGVGGGPRCRGVCVWSGDGVGREGECGLHGGIVFSGM